MADGATKQTSTTTQTRTPVPASASELAAQQRADAQLAAYEKQLNDYLSSPTYTTSQALVPVAQQNMLNNLNGTAMLPPQQEAYLRQAFAYPLQQGQDRLRQQAQQAAQLRGMTIADSPIGGEYLRNLTDYLANMGSQQAQAGLNLGQQNFTNAQQAAGFGQNLAQQGMTNRLALVNAGAGLQNQLAQQRIALAPTTQTTRGTTTIPFSQTFGQYAQGIGNLSQGLMGSTRDASGNVTSGGLLNLIPGGQKVIPNAIGAAGEGLWNLGKAGYNAVSGGMGGLFAPKPAYGSNIPNSWFD